MFIGNITVTQAAIDTAYPLHSDKLLFVYFYTVIL